MINLQQKLLGWFHKNARALPWREHYRPYEVWVSEIMLQQTQVETMLPYFKRWMRAFPTVRSLAKAEERQVLKLWEGLGYYSRARNLHQSARWIMERHEGAFPEKFEAIQSLRGIGRYTAGAIASIAFNQNRPIVDGNILRVLSRVYAITKPTDVGKNKAIFWELQEKLIPKGQARYFNQALMELGALICKKESPLCASCPIRQHCQAYRNGNPESYPVKLHKKKMVKVIAAALVIEQDGKFLIRKRPVGEIMGGLWEFPEWKLAKDKALPFAKIRKKMPGKYLGVIKRNYTHHLETLHVFQTAFSNNGVPPKLGKSWIQSWITRKEFSKYPFSSAHAKITKLVDPN